MVELSGVVKRYGERFSLEIPALSISAGERIALIGPNGCGKSTLLRLVAGTVRPDEGKVSLCGLRGGEIGYLPQKPFAFDLSVKNNVALALSGGKEAKKLALEALERVGLAHLAGERGSRLSGGEAQRMALARVLARPRKLLLLDEPTASADIAAIEQIERALEAYLQETGCALVFSSHAPSQAKRLASRTIVLDGGRIVEQGETADVLEHPAQESTRAFLEHWNV